MKLRNIITVFIPAIFIIFTALESFAVPTLQIGAPAGSGDVGQYADYGPDDTAYTSGDIIYAAAAYRPGDIKIGGKFWGGKNWSHFGFSNVFNSAGAVLMATVPDGTLGSGSLMISINGGNYIQAFFTTSTYENGFQVPNPPANHAPIQDQDYLFFNLGDFWRMGIVPDFASETGAALGQIKTLSIMTSGYEWIHFDLFAIVTTLNGKCSLSSTITGNPGSHDVTWTSSVPEPGTFLLLGIGILGVSLYARRHIKIR